MLTPIHCAGVEAAELDHKEAARLNQELCRLQPVISALQELQATKQEVGQPSSRSWCSLLMALRAVSRTSRRPCCRVPPLLLPLDRRLHASL